MHISQDLLHQIQDCSNDGSLDPGGLFSGGGLIPLQENVVGVPVYDVTMGI